MDAYLVHSAGCGNPDDAFVLDKAYIPECHCHADFQQIDAILLSDKRAELPHLLVYMVGHGFTLLLLGLELQPLPVHCLQVDRTARYVENHQSESEEMCSIAKDTDTLGGMAAYSQAVMVLQ